MDTISEKTVRSFSYSALILLFTVLTLFLRTTYLTDIDGERGIISSGFGLSVCDGDLRPCIRLAGSILQLFLSYLSDFISFFLYFDLPNSFLFTGNSSFINQRPATDIITSIVIPSLGQFLYIFCVVWTIFYLGQKIQKNFWTGLSISILMMSAVVGWPPIIVNMFFNLMLIISDWPIFYFLFSSYYKSYDLMSVIFVIAVILYLVEGENRRPIHLFTLAFLGQFTMDHLGLIFVLSLFLFDLFGQKNVQNSIQWRFSLRNSAVALSGAVFAGGCTILIFYGNSMNLDYEEQLSIFSVIERVILPEKNINLKNNLGWFSVLVAIYITFLSIPAVLGLILGMTTGIICPIKSKEYYNLSHAYFLASSMIVLTLSFVFLCAIFFLAYPAEMGRQFLTFNVIASIPFFLGARLFLYSFNQKSN